MDFFGYTIDTAGTFLVIKTHKACVPRIKRQICTVLKQGSASARVIAKVAGLCVSVAWAVTPGKLFFRLVQTVVNQVVFERHSVPE